MQKTEEDDLGVIKHSADFLRILNYISRQINSLFELQTKNVEYQVG